MRNRIKISAVSYTNSFPFIYGLQNHPVSELIDLQLDMPSDCARKLLNGEVELGLVPVAVMPELEEAHIISNFCIGADGPVESVCLFSEVPLQEVETILLDYQSRTSVELVKYLAENAWEIKPHWQPAKENFIEKVSGTTAGVVIGDRAFPLLESYPFVYDLSGEWKEQTGLPFVFACWISNRKLPDDFITEFEKALAFGLSQRRIAVEQMANADQEKLVRYVETVISYSIDDKKRQAMKLFLDWLSMPK
jgi:chorismate dehydratase